MALALLSISFVDRGASTTKEDGMMMKALRMTAVVGACAFTALALLFVVAALLDDEGKGHYDISR